jgi:M6 family metalloprotease-like protein
MNADAALNRTTNGSYYKSRPSFLRSSSELDLTPSEHGQRQLNPNTGTFTFLVILVQFTDHQDRGLPSVEHIQELCDGTGTSPINPAGSIAEYFAQQSYGKFKFNCDVRDWRLTDNTEDFYAQGQRGVVGTLEGQEFFKPVLNDIEADELAANPFYFFGLDGNSGDNNGLVELIVLHSGYASESTETDCYGRGRSDRIWSQGHIGDDGGWETKDGTFAVKGYTVASALDVRDDCSGQVGAKMGKSNRLVVSVLCTVAIG